MIQDDNPVIPIGIYRAAHPTILGNESPYMITNPEKSTLLLTGDIVFVLGDSKEHAMARQQEFMKGLQEQEGASRFEASLKTPNKEYSEGALNKADDDVVLGLLKKELTQAEKDRKKPKFMQKTTMSKSNKNNLEGFLEAINEELGNKSEESKQDIPNRSKIVTLEKRNSLLVKTQDLNAKVRVFTPSLICYRAKRIRKATRWNVNRLSLMN